MPRPVFAYSDLEIGDPLSPSALTKWRGTTRSEMIELPGQVHPSWRPANQRFRDGDH